MSARNVYLWIHRTLGLTLGAFFVVLGITGALLANRSNVDAFFDPAPYHVSDSSMTVGPDAAAAIARRAEPRGRLTAMEIPHVNGGPGGAVYVVHLKQPRGAALIYVDPHDGRVLAERSGTAGVTRWIHDLHQDLLLGKIGKKIVAGLGAALMLTTAIGVALWPGWRNFRSGLSLKRGASFRRTSYDVHKILGIAASVFLMFFAASGIILTDKGAARAVVGLKIPPPPRVPAHGEDARPLPISALLAAARGAFPDGEPRAVSFPTVAGHPVAVDVIGSDDIDRIDGNKRVQVDPITGAVLGRFDPMRDRAGFTDIVSAFHEGRLWGNGAARAAATLVGLVPLLLFGSAVLVWALRLREARPRAAARAARQVLTNPDGSVRTT